MNFHSQCELHLTVLSDSQVCHHFWAVPFTKSSVAVLPVKQLLHFKVQMASSHHNSSMLTPVPPLGTSFNTILHFSDNLAYLPNTPQCSRCIHQRDWSSLKSSSHIIQPSWIVSSIPSPSIISVDNNPNWKDAPATNLTSNRPTSSTHS